MIEQMIMCSDKVTEPTLVLIVSDNNPRELKEEIKHPFCNFTLMYSDKVTEPTLVLIIPENIPGELKEEIRYSLCNSTQENIQNESLETNKAFEQAYFEYSGNATLSKTDVEWYLKKKNLKFNGKDIQTPEDEYGVDWFSFFADMIRISNLRFINNKKFTQSLGETLFSALIGYSIAIGGEVKTIKTSMIGIYYKERGIVWLTYPNKKMRVILGEGFYNDIDTSNKVFYSKKMRGVQEALQKGIIKESQVKSSTFGEYPYYQADLGYDGLDDPDFIRDLIEKSKKCIIKKMK